jgi:translation initiation factor 3 subunit L
LFLAIYAEVTHRHLHSVSRPTAQDRMEGWNVYRELLDELLEEENVSATRAPFLLSPDWAFDILHEFVYQFQGFCQFRAAVHQSAAKHNIDPTAMPTNGVPHHLAENLTQLQQNPDAWAVETVTYYLNRLMKVGKTSNVPGYQYLGIFASIALSRLECLLGDYEGCLAAAKSMMDLTVVGETSQEILHSCLSARLSHAYHAGVALFMTRRYQWCMKLLGDTCHVLGRGLKSGQFRKLAGSDQFGKLQDRMLALLAIVSHQCPARALDENLTKTIREKHGSTLAKIEEGSASYESLFLFASPKFISPASSIQAGDNYKLQVRQFNKLMTNNLKLRSYMGLYTSISTSKLAAFADQSEEDFTSSLVSYKHQMRQEEEDGEFKEALDIHYHLNGKMVNVDEAEKQRRFETYFMKQIRQNTEIRKDVGTIEV